MGYDFRCERCGYNYYTVGSGTWYKSGTVTRYPSSGYCGCCGGKGRNPGWSWSGSVVKLECRGCSNLIGVVRWSDWSNSSGESTGFCSGCRDGWNNKKQEWERRKSAANNCEWASVQWDGWSNYDSLCSADFRIKCHAKYHSVYSGSSHSSIMDYLYKSKCPRCVKEARSDFCPSSFILNEPSWCVIDKKINDELWTKCIVYCKKYKVHVLYNGTNHQDIISALKAKECRHCRSEQDALKQEQDAFKEAENKRKEAENKRKEAEERRKEAERREKEAEKQRKEKEMKAKKEQKQQFDAAKAEATKTASNFKNKADKIKQQIKNIGNFNDNAESKTNGIDNKLDESRIVDLEQQITDNINSINKEKNEIENVLNDCKGLSDKEKERATIETQQELDKILDVLQNEQDVIIKYKSTLSEHNKKLDEEKKKVIEEQKEIQQQILDEMENKKTVDVVQQQIDGLLQNIQQIPGDQIKANPAAIKSIKNDHNELIKKLKEKNNENAQLTKELTLCQRRLSKLRGQIAKSQSENIYLMKLLNEEYDRLNEAAESAEMKFEENGIYFLSITNGFDQGIVDLFVNAGYEGLDDIKSIDDEQGLIDIGLNDAKQRRKVMRKLKIK